MSKQYYEIGQTFVDEKSGNTLMCIEGMCNTCFYIQNRCNTSPSCTRVDRKDLKSVCFIDISVTFEQTQLTQQLLLSNGWIQLDNDNVFELDKIRIFCVDGFTCGLQTKQNEFIGEPFTTVGELKAIAKALYKVELEFK